MIQKQDRNLGIDLLRLVAMWFVLILHTLGQGGVLAALQRGTALYGTAWYLEILAYCAVDIFALISGFAAYRDEPRQTRLSSYITLWLQVVFWGVVTALFFCLLWPERFSLRGVLGMCFPLKNSLYWYFSAYTGLFIVKPLLDRAVSGCSDALARKLTVLIVLVFSCFNLFFDRFQLASGYSFIWLVLLYVLGSFLKKCRAGERLTPLLGLLQIFLLITLTWLCQFLTDDPLMHELVSYTSPTILLTAMIFVVLFSRLRLPKAAAAFVRFAAPGAFAAYLLNNQRDMWSFGMKQRFVFLAEGSPLRLVLVTLSFSLGFVLLAVTLDKLRQLLFRLLRVQKLAETAERLAETVLSALGRRL